MAASGPAGRGGQAAHGGQHELPTWQATAAVALGARWTVGAVVRGVGTAAAAAAAVALITVALAVLSDGGGSSGNTQALRQALLGADDGTGSGLPLPLLVAVLLAAECVLAPLAEELVFRRVLLSALALGPLAGTEAEAAPASTAASTSAVAGDSADVVVAQPQAEPHARPEQCDSAAPGLHPLADATLPASRLHATAPPHPAPEAAAAPSPTPTVSVVAQQAPAWRPEWSGPLVLQAVAFAAYHLNPGELLPQAALGGVLGAAYLVSGRNLAVPLTGHALYNGAAVALLLLQDQR
ncbi:hypothetical protein HYH02_000544 [Chlamydomonas schloesseri]|uniref:CAAX prenyl protease 2/Lysostaphin resistance protein A-like domain-containing protein n=1 Tax=Chlamydomonas schloesseri TaxID=2026947 RepID=A0A835WVC2_9CHLO|nr:hypothetical protein HYH02_000544 [Chlamydomonas schloesseri]|eukprot:KAG2454707.1 hypothetical protein HYH02_000544 [Chlamydomonas schloesseri]